MFKNALKKMVLGLALMGSLAAPAMADTCVNLSWQPQPNLQVGVAINAAPVVVTPGYAPVVYGPSVVYTSPVVTPVLGWYPHPIHDRYWHRPVVVRRFDRR